MAWLFVPNMKQFAASRCVPALVDSSLPLGSYSPIVVPSCTSRGKRLPPPRWSRVWQMVRWIRRLSGTTWPRSMADAGVDAWISSLPGSRVNRGALPATATGSMTNDGSGLISEIAFAKWIPHLSGWRMCLPLFPEEDWPPFSQTWPSSGSMRNGVVSPQLMSEPVIAANDCSSWPTITESDSRSSARHTTTTGVMHPGPMLTDAVRLWRTPDAPNDGGPRNRQTSIGHGHQVTIAEQAEHWPTPAARDYKGENSETHLKVATGRKHLDQLPNYVAHLWNTPRAMEGGPRQPDGRRSLGLNTQAETLWATPRAEDSEQCGNHPGANDSLTGQTRLWQTPQTDSFRSRSGERRDEQGLDQQTRHWPTPTAEPYGSSQNGINGKGGAFERPSANTPSLERLSHSFLPLLATSMPGETSSPSAPSSRPRSAEMSWSTPRVECNVQNTKNVTMFAAGGRTSKPGLAQQAVGSLTTKGKAKLNPRFVEWLMGLPRGWISFAPAATPLSLWRPRMRFALWQLVRGRSEEH